LGAGKWEKIWKVYNKDFRLDFGKWMELQIGVRCGKGTKGRAYLAVKKQNGAWEKVLDVRNDTYNTNSPTLVPFDNWNPMKMYTSNAVVDFVRSEGGVMQMYWDDIEIYFPWPNSWKVVK
jgi:hypothetical protein